MAVKVTAWPKAAGFADAATVVVVEARSFTRVVTTGATIGDPSPVTRS